MPLKDFTKEEIIAKVNKCTSLSALARELNYHSRGAILGTIKNYLLENDIDFSHFTGLPQGRQLRTPENIFIENSTAAQKVLRRHYKEGNYSPYKCAICGQEPFWNGKELSLTLDHINGNNTDDRLENLRWICPNCDRQLDTYGSKNWKNLKAE